MRREDQRRLAEPYVEPQRQSERDLARALGVETPILDQLSDHILADFDITDTNYGIGWWAPEGEVPFTFSSDKTKKENFQPVDGTEVLRKLRGFNLTSWNYIGHDPNEFRHYGPVAQEFFAAFGHDGIGTAGSPTTINSGDLAGILSAVQELAKQNLELKSDNDAMKAQLDSLEQLIRSDHVGRVLSVVEK